MATSQDEHAGIRPNDSVCARDYVLDRLQDADSPMAPSDLAGEYGCSNGHARNVLSDLLSDDEVARVGRGEYVAPPPEDADSETDVLTGVPAEIRESGAAVEDSDSEEVQADSDAPGNDRPEDGQARSEDTDTTAGDLEGSEMPTEEEYQQFKATSGVEGNETGADDGEDIDESVGDALEPVAAEGAEEIDATTEQGGIPIVAVVVGAIALIAVYWFVFRDSGQGSQPAQSTQQSGSKDGEGETVSLIG